MSEIKIIDPYTCKHIGVIEYIAGSVWRCVRGKIRNGIIFTPDGKETPVKEIRSLPSEPSPDNFFNQQ